MTNQRALAIILKTAFDAADTIEFKVRDMADDFCISKEEATETLEAMNHITGGDYQRAFDVDYWEDKLKSFADECVDF